MQLIAWAFCYAQLKDGIQPLTEIVIDFVEL